MTSKVPLGILCALALGMTCALALGHVAAADEGVDQPWADPFERTAPVSGGFQVSGAAALSNRTQRGFTRFTAAVPLFVRAPGGAGPAWAFGVVIDGGMNLVSTPAEGRTGLTPSALRGEAWFLFYGRDRRSQHGLIFAGGAPPLPNNTMLYDHRSTAPHAGIAYDGYVNKGRFNVSLRVDAGWDRVQTWHAAASMVFSIEASDTVAVQAGVRGAFTVLNVANLGVRWRPFPGVELGAGALAPFYDTEHRLGRGLPVQPQIDLAVWDSRGPRSWR